MDDLSAILASIFSSGTFNEMLRRATPVALAAIGGSLTEHAGIMNIGMDGMILMGAFFRRVRQLSLYLRLGQWDWCFLWGCSSACSSRSSS